MQSFCRKESFANGIELAAQAVCDSREKHQEQGENVADLEDVLPQHLTHEGWLHIRPWMNQWVPRQKKVKGMQASKKG